MLELSFLLIGIIILFLIVYYVNQSAESNTVEHFDQNHYLESCPSGYKSFYDHSGDIICCDGEIVANKCISERRCALNGKGSTDMPNCISFLTEEYKEHGKKQCPSTMTSYFEDRGKKIKGCTNGLLNATMTGPLATTQAKCMIYDSWDKNMNSLDSCLNQKELNEFDCSAASSCSKSLNQTSTNKPVLIKVTFSDTNGASYTGTTRKSLERSLNVTNPRWKEQGIDLSRNIQVAEVLYAVYILKTMDRRDIQL